MIEKGVPIPVARKSKWLFIEKMEVGDSILLETADEYDKARYSMIYYCKKNNWSYQTRKQPDGTGYRIWRTA